MFSIETVSSVNVADVCMTSKRNLLYGVVELNAKDTFAPGAAARILAGGIGAAAGADAAQWPSAMAKGVTRTLDGFTSTQYPGHVMGAFLSMSDGLIRVCWAGTIRVHLIRRGATIRVTNDHNLIDDPVDGVPESLFTGGPETIASWRFATSRLIGQGAARRPESQIWEREPRDVLLICSVYNHRNAAPSEYTHKLVSDYTEMLDDHNYGFISVIRTAPRLPAE